MRFLFFSICFFVVFSACSTSKKNQHGNPGKKHSKVLILGNSILKHRPAPEIGWNHNWGMAASAADSDFLHRLQVQILRKNPEAVIEYRNIADFERNYRIFNMEELAAFKNADIIIMKIGENVKDAAAVDSNFIKYYDRLLKFLDKKNKARKVLVDGFWENKNVNRLIRNYARQNHYPFVSITALSGDPDNKATGLYENKAVAAHPSDKGMRLIAEKIWEVVNAYL
ncbi:MAG TPA: SGNH/GDSL hydrolase family protein [Niabella sp.]